MSEAIVPHRNIEIKAKIHDLDQFLLLAKNVSGYSASVLKQKDVFFNVPKGRLKLRNKVEKGSIDEQLIYYDRPDELGPKTSSFFLAQGSGVNGGLQPVQAMLTACLGVRGEVTKTRHLFMVGQTRLHVDQVQGLGDFMELEVVLREDQTAAEGQTIAEDLMKRLGVQEADLLTGAYMDMIENSTNSV